MKESTINLCETITAILTLSPVVFTAQNENNNNNTITAGGTLKNYEITTSRCDTCQRTDT